MSQDYSVTMAHYNQIYYRALFNIGQGKSAENSPRNHIYGISYSKEPHVGTQENTRGLIADGMVKSSSTPYLRHQGSRDLLDTL